MSFVGLVSGVRRTKVRHERGHGHGRECRRGRGHACAHECLIEYITTLTFFSHFLKEEKREGERQLFFTLVSSSLAS